ncbi:MAG: hypothetical protein KTR24_15310 [Saprospiraceae bacterium]|nr:hypothetical protein [Saprospiraceae bacterium]
MKTLVIVLTVLLFGMTLYPCATSCCDHAQTGTEISDRNRQKENSGDCCPVLCSCVCCGHLLLPGKIDLTDGADFLEPGLAVDERLDQSYFHRYQPNIWHPPSV